MEEDEATQGGRGSIANLALALVLTAAVAIIVYVAIQLW